MPPLGYDFRLVHTDRRNEAHLQTKYLYRFKTRLNRTYLVEIEEYRYDTYAIKFYLKNHADSPNRYNLLTHDGDAFRILSTCLTNGIRNLTCWRRQKLCSGSATRGCKQLIQLHTKRLADTVGRQQTRIAFPPLNALVVRQINIGPFRYVGLRNALSTSGSFDIGRYRLPQPNVFFSHGAKVRRKPFAQNGKLSYNLFVILLIDRLYWGL